MAGMALGIGFIVKSHDEKIPFFTHYLIILVGFIPYTSHIYDVIEYYIINGWIILCYRILYNHYIWLNMVKYDVPTIYYIML